MGELLVGSAICGLLAGLGSVSAIVSSHNFAPLAATAVSGCAFALMLKRYESAQTKNDKSRSISFGVLGTSLVGASFFVGMPLSVSFLVGGFGSAFFGLCFALSANAQ